MKKLLHFAPRILSILFCAFIFLFSLDVFEGASGPLDIAIGLFMHNIPVLIMATVTFFAWKNDVVGLLGFAAIGVGLILLVFSRMGPEDGVVNPAIFIVSGPAFLISALYGHQVHLNKK